MTKITLSQLSSLSAALSHLVFVHLCVHLCARKLTLLQRLSPLVLRHYPSVHNLREQLVGLILIHTVYGSELLFCHFLLCIYSLLENTSRYKICDSFSGLYKWLVLVNSFSHTRFKLDRGNLILEIMKVVTAFCLLIACHSLWPQSLFQLHSLTISL